MGRYVDLRNWVKEYGNKKFIVCSKGSGVYSLRKINYVGKFNFV